MARDRNIDNLRNFAIITVVLGHAIQYAYMALGLDFMNYYVTKIIYSFHMPLFVFISGWVTWGSSFGSWKSLLKKARVLLIPLVVWALIVKLIDTPTLDVAEWLVYYKNVLTGANFGWFLVMIFLCHCIHFIVIKLPEKLQIFAALLISALLYFRFNIGNVGFLYVFFFIGYYLHQNYANLLAGVRKWSVITIGIIISLILSYFWEFYILLDNYYITGIYKFVNASIWIVTLYALFYKVNMDILTRYCKNNTLEIYVTHYVPQLLLLLILERNPYWNFSSTVGFYSNVAILFIGGMVLTLLLIKFLTKSRLLSTILYAKKY